MWRAVLMFAAAAAACGDNIAPPDARDISFEFHATAGWNASNTPNVVSMTIGGQDVPGGFSAYEIDMKFASYEDARATFTPLLVVITTMAGKQTSALTLGQCDSALNFECSANPPPVGCPEAVTYEEDAAGVAERPDVVGGAAPHPHDVLPDARVLRPPRGVAVNDHSAASAGPHVDRARAPHGRKIIRDAGRFDTPSATGRVARERVAARAGIAAIAKTDPSACGDQHDESDRDAPHAADRTPSSSERIKIAR